MSPLTKSTLLESLMLLEAVMLSEAVMLLEVVMSLEMILLQFQLEIQMMTCLRTVRREAQTSSFLPVMIPWVETGT